MQCNRKTITGFCVADRYNKYSRCRRFGTQRSAIRKHIVNGLRCESCFTWRKYRYWAISGLTIVWLLAGPEYSYDPDNFTKTLTLLYGIGTGNLSIQSPMLHILWPTIRRTLECVRFADEEEVGLVGGIINEENFRWLLLADCCRVCWAAMP
jgi:hypothetical protein